MPGAKVKAELKNQRSLCTLRSCAVLLSCSILDAVESTPTLARDTTGWWCAHHQELVYALVLLVLQRGSHVCCACFC